MAEESAVEFYDRLTKGKDYSKSVTLEHSSGAELEGVEVHPVSKQTLASVIERLPDEMFEAVEKYEDADEAEEMMAEEGGAGLSAVTASTVSAFEDLVSESLVHPDLTNTQIEDIVSELSFEVLFDLGTEVIDISFERGGDVKDFHVRR